MKGGPSITDEELARLAKYQATRCPRLKEELVRDYYWIVDLVARRYHGKGEPREDIVQVAAVGLVAALERYDPESKGSFPTFAIPTALGEVRRHFRDRTWRVRVPRGVKDLAIQVTAVTDELTGDLERMPSDREVADRLGVEVERVGEARAASRANHPLAVDASPTANDAERVIDLRDGDPEDPVEGAGTRMLIEQLLESLPERNRTIVRLRYFHDLSQEEIAARIGISQPHVSRLLRSSLSRMRERLEVV